MKIDLCRTRAGGASVATLAAALLLAPAAMAQDATAPEATGAIGGYAQLDANQDQALDAAEFRPFVDQTYDAWQTDADDLLGEEEFYAGLFGSWDRDANAILTREEYERGYASWFEDIEVEGPAYDAIAARENELMEDAFTTAAGEAGIYEAWVGQGEPVDRETFAEIMFGRMAGDDAQLSEAEFELIYPG